MALTLRQLLEHMEASQQEDTEAMEAIRIGLNIRENFWDDFLALLNNAEALSELLDVPSYKISGWYAKITMALKQVQDADQSEDEHSNKRKLI